MAIDPDMQPILDGIAARLSALETAPAPAGEAVDLGPLTARVAALEGRLAAMAAALAGLTTPDEPEPVALPEGYRHVGDFRRAYGNSANWTLDELILTQWSGGAGTMGDPSLIEFGADGSALLRFADGAPPRAGVMQLNKPAKPIGKWGMTASDIKPGAVAAFFVYGSNGKEIDFELGKVNGAVSWILGIHIPKPGGGTVSSEKVIVPFDPAARRHEFEMTADAISFWIDGEEVARFTSADVPGATWDTTTNVQALCSVEKHGSWAGWQAADYTANTGQMRVHALMA